MIGSIVIIIKKLISGQIVKKIPKSNILPQHRIGQEPSSESFQMATLHSTPRSIEVGQNAETYTGNLSFSNSGINKVALVKNALLPMSLYSLPRTTDAQRGNSLHCTAKNSLPLPNF